VDELEQLRLEVARLTEENQRLWSAVERVKELAAEWYGEPPLSPRRAAAMDLERALGEAGR
jgi:hypothetical protein